MKPPSRQVPDPPGYSGFKEAWIESSIPDLFDRQAVAFAGKEAIRSGDSVLSYSELAREVNRVAAEIIDRTIRIDHGADSHQTASEPEPVAVFLDQGIEAVVALLGSLKAGRLVLFLDPDDPYTRNRHLLNHAPARIVFTDRERLEVARELAPEGADIILVEICDGVSRSDKTLQNPDSSSPACLLYTSGSTGRPKGTMDSHRCILHDIAVKTALLRISPGDRLALLAWGTGQALKIIFSALLNGATLCLYNLKQKGVGHLSGWLSDQKITVLIISSPVFRGFSEALPDGAVFPQMRIIRLASDTVYPADVARCRELFPNASHINALSSNETGTIAGMVLDPASVAKMDHVPIGYPMDGMEVKIEDEAGNPVSDGTPGILSVTSRYIAHGYWRDPERTRTAFTTDSDDPERMVFRSGDLAYWNPDGSLQLCGRRDFQVKIRGYRVDLQEVEARLMEHPDISEAVVHAIEESNGSKRLVGYFVSRRQPVPSASALMRFLEDKVTAYMIPSSFVSLKRIPLLPNGKTNRHVLPNPGHKRPELDNAYLAPRSAVEQQLAEIWSDVTGIETVGINDPFMELGGDSLRAGQVMARVLETFGVDLLLPVLFECPTVAALAHAIETGAKGPGDPVEKTPAIRRETGNGPFPLSFGQQRLWFLDQFDPESTAYNMPKLIRISGPLDLDALTGSLDWVLRRHEVLRTHYRSRDGVPYVVVDEPDRVPLPIVDLGELAPSRLEAVLDEKVAMESLRRFDLEHDLKLRTTLYRAGSKEHYLLCVTHHIASDGWSRGILMRELSSHYSSLLRGERPMLEELPIQYSDFARHQLEQSESGAFRHQLAWWKRLLDNAPGPLELPADHPRPASLSSRGAAYIRWISRNRSDALEDLARDRQVTLFMLLMAAFNVLIYRYTNRKDLLVGFPVAGRKAVETEDLIGFFVNSLILRCDLSGNPAFHDFLGQVRERALGAYANPDVPFEQVVNAMRVERDASRNPLFQVMFDVHRLRSSRITSDAVTFELMDSKRPSTVVDQVWNVAVSGDGLRVRIEYSTDLFEEATVGKMADDYCLLLDAILENPEAPVDDLARCVKDAMELTNETEETLAAIWASLLGEPPAKRETRFFDSGGHSLKAMRFVADIKSRLGVQVSIREFFDHPGFGDLVSLVERKRSGEGR